MRKIKKNKISNYTLIGMIYVILLLTISTAYSFFNEDLSISATSSTLQNGENYIIDNTLTSKKEENGIYYYEYSIVLTYTGSAITSGWESYIKIPFDSEITECYNASTCIVEGETLTIKNNTVNGNLSPNNTSTTYNFKFKTSDSNYIFNVLGVKFLVDTSSETPDNSSHTDLPLIEDISGNLSILYDWGTTKQYLFEINNNSKDTTIQSWTVHIKIPNNFVINALWSATWNYDDSTNILTISGPEWSPTIFSSTKVEINMNITTPIEEKLQVIDFTGTTTTNEQFQIPIIGGAA